MLLVTWRVGAHVFVPVDLERSWLAQDATVRRSEDNVRRSEDNVRRPEDIKKSWPEDRIQIPLSLMTLAVPLHGAPDCTPPRTVLHVLLLLRGEVI